MAPRVWREKNEAMDWLILRLSNTGDKEESVNSTGGMVRKEGMKPEK